MGCRKGGFACLINRIFTALGLSFTTEPTFITVDHSMRPMNTRALAATPLTVAGLVILPLALAACGYQPSIGDYRPLVDSYNINMVA